MSESAGGGPNPLLIHANTEQEIGPGVFVIPDRRVNLVPNVGIVLGDDAVLVVDTGIGPANGDLVRAEAQRLGGSRRMYVTLTHFHPEHGFGAQSFAGGADLVYNRAQADELAANGQEFVELFTTFGPEVAELLAPVELVEPQETYEGRLELELGGRTVELREFGGAHTLGDQVVLLPEERIMFAGDLVENRFFPIVFGVAERPGMDRDVGATRRARRDDGRPRPRRSGRAGADPRPAGVPHRCPRPRGGRRRAGRGRGRCGGGARTRNPGAVRLVGQPGVDRLRDPRLPRARGRVTGAA